MATRQYRIVSAEDSEIHDEPHIEGNRVTVGDVQARVEERVIVTCDDDLVLEVGEDDYRAVLYVGDATLSVEQVPSNR